MVLEQDVLEAMAQYGFQEEHTRACLTERKHNHVTTTSASNADAV